MATARLVFVDDDPDDRDLIRDGMLINGEERFIVLDSGAAFFDYLNGLAPTELPEVIVLDLNMPVMNGQDILKQLKSTEAYKDLPVYMLTTSSDNQLKQRCIAAGAAGYYTKPTSLMELHTLLNEIIMLE